MKVDGSKLTAAEWFAIRDFMAGEITRSSGIGGRIATLTAEGMLTSGYVDVRAVCEAAVSRHIDAFNAIARSLGLGGESGAE